MLASSCQSRSPDLLASIRQYVVQEASKDSIQSCATHHCMGLLSKKLLKLNIIPKIGRSSIGASYIYIQVIVEVMLWTHCQGKYFHLSSSQPLFFQEAQSPDLFHRRYSAMTFFYMKRRPKRYPEGINHFPFCLALHVPVFSPLLSSIPRARH
jgi:hypothetical protein